MARYRLTIAYDGTDLHGWQKQDLPPGAHAPSAAVIKDADHERAPLRTAQELVEQAVRAVVREPLNIQGASRTDAGVHAIGQVATFACSDDCRRPPDERLAAAINAQLPDDVQVVSADPCREDFDPISDCVSKGYRYRLATGLTAPLWDRHYVHHIWTDLDAHAMRDAAALIVGEHDFGAFAKAGHGRLTTVRTVLACYVARSGPDRLDITISGTGFLHNMVRIIAGTLVEIGRGRLRADAITRAIESGDRREAGPTLPPTGLCLEWIRYRNEAQPSEGAMQLPDLRSDES